MVQGTRSCCFWSFVSQTEVMVAEVTETLTLIREKKKNCASKQVEGCLQGIAACNIPFLLYPVLAQDLGPIAYIVLRCILFGTIWLILCARLSLSLSLYLSNYSVDC